MQLTITRGVHATAIIASPTTTVVVDPGFFGYPDNVHEMAAVLVTHDHFDHVDLPSLVASLRRNPALQVYAPTPLALEEFSDQVHIIAEDDTFTVGDLTVRVVGKEQAVADLDDDVIVNVGYLIADTILHPGDARPELMGVDTMFTALAAPWQNNPQLQGYLRKVQPRRVIGLHDATLSDMGREFAQRTLANIAASYGGEAVAMNVGDSLTIEAHA